MRFQHLHTSVTRCQISDFDDNFGSEERQYEQSPVASAFEVRRPAPIALRASPSVAFLESLKGPAGKFESCSSAGLRDGKNSRNSNFCESGLKKKSDNSKPARKEWRNPHKICKQKRHIVQRSPVLAAFTGSAFVENPEDSQSDVFSSLDLTCNEMI